MCFSQTLPALWSVGMYWDNEMRFSCRDIAFSLHIFILYISSFKTISAPFSHFVMLCKRSNEKTFQVRWITAKRQLSVAIVTTNYHPAWNKLKRKNKNYSNFEQLIEKNNEYDLLVFTEEKNNKKYLNKSEYCTIQSIILLETNRRNVVKFHFHMTNGQLYHLTLWSFHHIKRRIV